MRTWRCVSVVVSVALMALGHAAFAAAAPGDLDLSFGNGGVTDLPFDPSVRGGGTDLAVAPDGRVYVLRQRHLACGASGCDSQTIVEALLPDGSVDGSFGNGGVVNIGEEPGTSLAVDSYGKVLVTTVEEVGTLTRLNPNGSVDESFGEKGHVRFGHNADSRRTRRLASTVLSLAIREDGRIVVAIDQGASSGSSQLELVQYRSNGTLDPSFGGGSAVTTDLQRGSEGLPFPARASWRSPTPPAARDRRRFRW